MITSDQRRQYNRFAADGCRKALAATNPSREGLQRLLGRGNAWQAYLEAGIAQFTGPTNYDFARTMLGSNFVSPEEIALKRGITYTDEQLDRFGDTLPSKDALRWCRYNGMMLVAGPPESMSLLDVRRLYPGFFCEEEGGWYADRAQKFAKGDKVQPSWLAFTADPRTIRYAKDRTQRLSLMTEESMSIPNAAQVVWCLTTHVAVCGDYVSEEDEGDLETSSIDSDAYGVCIEVRHLGEMNLGVNSYPNPSQEIVVGIPAVRTF